MFYFWLCLHLQQTMVSLAHMTGRITLHGRFGSCLATQCCIKKTLLQSHSNRKIEIEHWPRGGGLVEDARDSAQPSIQHGSIFFSELSICGSVCVWICDMSEEKTQYCSLNQSKQWIKPVIALWIWHQTSMQKIRVRVQMTPTLAKTFFFLYDFLAGG